MASSASDAGLPLGIWTDIGSTEAVCVCYVPRNELAGLILDQGLEVCFLNPDPMAASPGLGIDATTVVPEEHA